MASSGLLEGLLDVAAGVAEGFDSDTTAPGLDARPLDSTPDRFEVGSQRRELEKLRELDPAFSVVMFEDFLFALFARTQEARGAGTLDELSAFLSPASITELSGGPEGLTGVGNVIVGAVTLNAVTGLSEGGPRVHVVIRVQSNYTEIREELSPQFWAVDVWRLSRLKTARARPPDRIRALGCPKCGGPRTRISAGHCSFCRTQVGNGDFDWWVESVACVEKTTEIPTFMGLDLGEAAEIPTFIDADAQSKLWAIGRRDPHFSWDGFAARVGVIFSELDLVWAVNGWARARPYVTDWLYETRNYWIELRRFQNVPAPGHRAELARLELARVADDAYHDLITLRVFARGLSHGHSPSSGGTPRLYSEYWTFIRGKEARGASGPSVSCPSCGGPLTLTMAGECQHCRSHVTLGEYDWVLSRIEQTEAYR